VIVRDVLRDRDVTHVAMDDADDSDDVSDARRHRHAAVVAGAGSTDRSENSGGTGSDV